MSAASHEVVLLSRDSGRIVRALSEWPLEPGGVRRASSGRAEILHFAPRRWLLPQAGEALLSQVRALAAEDVLTVTDVAGKWRHNILRPAEARAIESCDVDVRHVLRDRACAAVMLFDCPGIIAAAPAAFEVWVPGSYEADFMRRISSLSANRARV